MKDYLIWAVEEWLKNNPDKTWDDGMEYCMTHDLDGGDYSIDRYLAEEKRCAQPEYFDYTDIDEAWEYYAKEQDANLTDNAKQIKDAMWVGYRIGLKSAQPERLTDDDFETIRIHLSAHKEQLCNQNRWKEAEEYQRIIDRFIAFVSAQPEYFDYTDIDEAWEYYAKEQDANLTDNAKQIKDAMWVGYRIGLKSAQPEIIQCKDCKHLRGICSNGVC